MNRFNILRILKGSYWKTKPKILINLYKSLARPIIDYANFPLMVANNSYFEKLQKIENKIIRMALSSSWYDTTQEIHKMANICMLKERVLELSRNYITNIKENNINIPILNLINTQEQIDENNFLIKKGKIRNTCLDLFY
jgi:hypothetical protein